MTHEPHDRDRRMPGERRDEPVPAERQSKAGRAAPFMAPTIVVVVAAVALLLYVILR